MRDEPPSNHCVSTQRPCLAAMASKLAGSTTAETKPSRVVRDQSKAGKIRNGELRQKLPTIHGQMWSSKTQCQTVCEKRNLLPRGHQWSPDFYCITPPIWVSEVSVARKSSTLGRGVGAVPQQRGGVLYFRKPLVPCRSTPTFLAPPCRRSVKRGNTCAPFVKKGSKNSPC